MRQEFQTMENRMAVLWAMAENRDNELITALCLTWLKMFPLAPTVDFLSLSQKD